MFGFPRNVIETVLEHILRREVRRLDIGSWEVKLDAVEDMHSDALRIRISRFRKGAVGEDVRKSFVATSTEIQGEVIHVASCRGNDALIGLMKSEMQRLLYDLFDDRCFEHEDCREHPDLGRACFATRKVA